MSCDALPFCAPCTTSLIAVVKPNVVDTASVWLRSARLDLQRARLPVVAVDHLERVRDQIDRRAELAARRNRERAGFARHRHDFGADPHASERDEEARRGSRIGRGLLGRQDQPAIVRPATPTLR